MGSLITNIFNSLSDMKAKVLMLGLDGAGKTTILYKLKLNETVSSVPTIGFNVEEINYRNLKMTVWDIGGQTRLRQMWHYYYENGNAIIYVLDSADSERIIDAKEALQGAMSHESMKNAPVLVFANKMDIARMSVREIAEKLGLPQERREWHLQPCCALNGDGLIEGFEWLRKTLKK